MSTADPTWLADPTAYGAALAQELRRDVYDRWRGVHHATTEEHIAHDAELIAALNAGDWNRYGWPEATGGLGGDILHRAAYYDALAAADLPTPEPTLMQETLAPALMHFAPHLAEAFLPAALAGQEWWGQGFSEPAAGSDLASLRCRARREDDHWVISGQKLWTTHGSTASRLVCLARTGTTESRHRGLSMIMIDADAPGVSIRPVAIASGYNELAEVFFDDVRVPLDRLVGEENGGWAVAMYLLQFERSMYAWQSGGVALRQLRRLRAELATGHTNKAPDGVVSRLGALYADIVTVRARSSRTLRRLASGQTIGPEASVDKVALARVETELHDLARDVHGADFVFGTDPSLTSWREDWWFSRSATILGGSSEVQRTIIADHVLGLPKEPS